MNCDLAGCLLDEYLENGLSQRDCQQLEKHLARCPHCAAELRRRPAFERDLRRALATSVRPLSLSAELSRRIIESAEQSLHRAVWSRRVALTFRLMSGALAAMLVLVAIFALLGHIPVASHFKPIALLPANKLPLSTPCGHLDRVAAPCQSPGGAAGYASPCALHYDSSVAE